MRGGVSVALPALLLGCSRCHGMTPGSRASCHHLHCGVAVADNDNETTETNDSNSCFRELASMRLQEQPLRASSAFLLPDALLTRAAHVRRDDISRAFTTGIKSATVSTRKEESLQLNFTKVR